MAKTVKTRTIRCRFLSHVILISLFLPVICGPARGQAAAEAAGATSVSATAGTEAKQVGFPATTLPKSGNKSPHLALPSAPPSEVTNREALERRAGQGAGKLLLRSVPTAARVWIDGVFVGNTPMLLILAPGKYRVEIQGQRSEYAASSLDLLPKETREVALTLAARYPTRVSVR